MRDSLKLAGFSHKRSADRALQMRVRRRPEAKARVVVKVKRASSTNEELTLTPESSSPRYPPPEQPLFWKKSKDKQTTTNYKKHVGRHKTDAHKRATTLFSEQATKPLEERLSAKKVSEAVDLEYGTGYSPSPRTIQHDGGFGGWFVDTGGRRVDFFMVAPLVDAIVKAVHGSVERRSLNVEKGL